MEPAYIKIPGLADADGQRLAGENKLERSLSLGAKAEVQSTASSEAGSPELDYDPDAEQVDADAMAAARGMESNQDLYAYGMMGDGCWNGWHTMPDAAAAAAANLYGGFGCWPPYPYGMPSMPMDMSGMGFPPSEQGGYDAWQAAPPASAGQSFANKPPLAPPPKSPLLKAAHLAGERELPAPPPGMAVVGPRHLDPPPGLAAPSSPPAHAAAVSSTTSAFPSPHILPRAAAKYTASEEVDDDDDAAAAVAKAVACDCLDDEDVAPPGLPMPVLSRAHSSPQDATSTALLPPPPMLARAKSTPVGAAAVPAAPAVDVEEAEEEGSYRVRWTVDARKLKVKDKVVVSPSFKLSTDQQGALGSTFRVVMYPTAVSDRKGGASFRKAKGKGSVHLKCESNIDQATGSVLEVYFLVKSVCEDDPDQETRRGPVLHNFFESGFCSLPKHESEWDFQRATEASSSESFVVLLEITAKDLQRR